MMTMPLVPLASLMFSAMFMITVARYSTPLALFTVALAALTATIRFRYKRRTLPRFSPEWARLVQPPLAVGAGS